jgi:HSP20 family protein
MFSNASWMDYVPATKCESWLNELVNEALSFNTFGRSKITPYNQYWTKSAMVLELSLPGFKKEGIEISYDSGTSFLSIKGKGGLTKDEDATEYVCRQIWESDVDLILSTKSLNDLLDFENVSSKLQDGILRIVIPKVEKKEESKKISIKIS